jgi:hypothetical protein
VVTQGRPVVSQLASTVTRLQPDALDRFQDWPAASTLSTLLTSDSRRQLVGCSLNHQLGRQPIDSRLGI